MGFSASSCYQAVRDAELFTVVCLPEKEGLYCEQASAKTARNTIVRGKSALTLYTE